MNERIAKKTAFIQSKKVHVITRYQSQIKLETEITRTQFYKIHNLLLSVTCISGPNI